MAAHAFDTSGLVKRYVAEVGTAWVQALTDPAGGHSIYVARITMVEVASAVVRRRRGGSLTARQASAILAQFRQDLSLEYRILEFTPALATKAVALAESHGLRAYDAVQLATTLELGRLRMAAGLGPVTLVSSDGELNAAAAAEGLPFEDPNRHP